MMPRNVSGHSGEKFLGLENLGVPIICHLVGRLGVQYTAILGVHHDVHLGFDLICRPLDLGAAH